MIGVLPCSGACNVGQVTPRAVAAAKRERPGKIGFVCVLGLPLQIGGIVKKAREDYVAHVALDGCQVACATKALGSVGLQPAEAIQVDRDAGVGKSGDLDDMSALEATTSSVIAAVERLLRGTP